MPSNEIMTLSEVAAYLQMGTGKLYNLAKAGDIPAAKIGRVWRFRRDLIDAWFVSSLSSADPQQRETATAHPTSEAEGKRGT